MDLSLNSVNVCSEAALSEMQTGGFAAAIEHRHLPPSSLPQSNAELGEHGFFCFVVSLGVVKQHGDGRQSL